MYRNKKATFCEEYRFYKWYLQESNRGHTDFQSDALPTELRHRLRLLFWKRVSKFLSISGTSRNRTGDTRIFSPMLYQLS